MEIIQRPAVEVNIGGSKLDDPIEYEVNNSIGNLVNIATVTIQKPRTLQGFLSDAETLAKWHSFILESDFEVLLGTIKILETKLYPVFHGYLQKMTQEIRQFSGTADHFWTFTAYNPMIRLVNSDNLFIDGFNETSASEIFRRIFEFVGLEDAAVITLQDLDITFSKKNFRCRPLEALEEMVMLTASECFCDELGKIIVRKPQQTEETIILEVGKDIKTAEPTKLTAKALPREIHLYGGKCDVKSTANTYVRGSSPQGSKQMIFHHPAINSVSQAQNIVNRALTRESQFDITLETFRPDIKIGVNLLVKEPTATFQRMYYTHTVKHIFSGITPHRLGEFQPYTIVRCSHG